MTDWRSHIILNGERFSKEEILRRADEIGSDPLAPDWQKELFAFLAEWFSPDDFVIANTSGSTGTPKPIRLPKKLMADSAQRTLTYFDLHEGERILLSLPAHYIAGKMMIVRAILGRMNLVAVDPKTDFSFLQTESFALGALVPNQAHKILEMPEGQQLLEKFQNLLIGGSSIPSTLEEKLAPLTNHIVSTYGMTETASHVAIRRLSGPDRSNAYHCLPGIDVELNDAGCLVVHVPGLAGPVVTNDMAELLPGNCFRVLGRADYTIISGGLKFSPETLEKKISPLFGCRLVVSSVPDEKLGEKLVLVLEGNPFDTSRQEQTMNDLLKPYERPKAIRFIDHFPETDSGKIRRSDVKQMLLQER